MQNTPLGTSAAAAMPRSKRNIVVASLCGKKGWGCQCCEMLQTSSNLKKIYEGIGVSTPNYVKFCKDQGLNLGLLMALAEIPRRWISPLSLREGLWKTGSKSVENPGLICGNRVESVRKSYSNDKNCKQREKSAIAKSGLVVC